MSTSKNTVHKACMGCLGLLLLGPGAVRAQQGNTELEHIQRAQQRSIQQAQDIKLPQADVFVTPPADKPAQALDASPSGAQSPCIALQSFVLLGHLPVMGDAPTLPVPPMCMDAQALNALLARLNAHYQTLGWITTRVYIDPAEQANQTLKLHVVPGRIEAYKLGNDEKDPRIKAAFPQRTANELNLRDLEQGLENINRLPSQQGQFKVLPGSENGQSIVQIDVQQKRSARVTEMVENSGTRSMGIWKSTTELALDNLAGLNDQLALGLISNLDRGDLRARFKGITFNYLVPRGYHLWSLSGSAIRTAFELPGINTSYPMQSQADKLAANYEYLFSRNQQGKHSLTAGLDITRQHTQIADIEIQSQQRRLTVLHLGYKGKYLPGQQSHEWTLQYELGLKAFNAQTSLPDATDPQYQLLKARLNSTWPLPQNTGLIRTVLQAQAGPRNTPVLAQLYAGGRYDVRGYQNNTLYAPSGSYLKTDYETPSASIGTSKWTAYAGLDAARVQTLQQRPLSQQYIVGGALGLRGEYGPLKVDIALARALSRPQEFKTEKRNYWYANASYVY